MLPILQIGPLAVPTPAIILLIGFWVGLELTERQAGRFGVEPGPIYNLILTGLIVGLIGARLAYAARSPAAFLDNPLSLLTPSPQMFDPTAGTAAGLAAAAIYVYAHKIGLWPVLDAAVSLFTVLGVAGGLAHLASGDAFGAPAQVPWAIELWGEARHPAQVYETLAMIIIGAGLWPTGRAAAGFAQHPGLRFWLWLTLMAAARLVLETFRGDSVLLWGSLRMAQGIAWVGLAVGLWQIGRRINPKPDLADKLETR